MIFPVSWINEPEATITILFISLAFRKVSTVYAMIGFSFMLMNCFGMSPPFSCLFLLQVLLRMCTWSVPFKFYVSFTVRIQPPLHLDAVRRPMWLLSRRTQSYLLDFAAVVLEGYVFIRYRPVIVYAYQNQISFIMLQSVRILLPVDLGYGSIRVLIVL